MEAHVSGAAGAQGLDRAHALRATSAHLRQLHLLLQRIPLRPGLIQLPVRRNECVRQLGVPVGWGTVHGRARLQWAGGEWQLKAARLPHAQAGQCVGEPPSPPGCIGSRAEGGQQAWAGARGQGGTQPAPLLHSCAGRQVLLSGASRGCAGRGRWGLLAPASSLCHIPHPAPTRAARPPPGSLVGR